MLQQELKDSNIPHRLTIRKRIDEVLEEHLTRLEEDMQVSRHTVAQKTVPMFGHFVMFEL